MSGLPLLFATSAAYIFSAAGEVWLIKALNNEFEMTLPVLTAIIINCYFPLELLLYWWKRRQLTTVRLLDARQLRRYCVIGTNAAAIVTTRSFGINYLPGTVYVIAASSEILFSTLLSRSYLKKRITAHQYASVVLVLCAITHSLYDPDCRCFGQNKSTTQKRLIAGILLSVLSRFLSAANSVLAERLLGVDRKSRLGVAELSLANSSVPLFLVLPIVTWASGEYDSWSHEVGDAPHSQGALAAVMIGLALAKMADRWSKFTVVNSRGAVFFGIVDAVMKIATGLGAVVLYGEDADWTDYVGLALVACALGVYLFGSQSQRVSKLDGGGQMLRPESTSSSALLGSQE